MAFLQARNDYSVKEDMREGWRQRLESLWEKGVLLVLSNRLGLG